MLARRLFASALAATAGLSVIPFTATAQPGLPAGINGYDQPGEGSVNSYVLVGPRSLAIVDCQRALPEARYPGYLRVAPPPNLIEMNADAVAKELRA